MKDLEYLAMEEKFWGVYDNNKRNIMLQNTMYDEGLKDGRAEGLEEGRTEGSKKRNIEIAKNMKENNIDIELVSNVLDYL